MLGEKLVNHEPKASDLQALLVFNQSERAYQLSYFMKN